MTPADYPAVITLWRACEGVGLSSADSPEAIARYLQRNPGLSFVACAEEEVIGALLAGHDGRRGFLHHLAVHPAYRRQGFARVLVERALHALGAEGIDKSHLFVYSENESGRAFWLREGWYERPELILMSKDLPVG